MAIATGTAAVITAGLGAAGVFGGAKIQANAAKRAAEAQRGSTDAALAYQREQDAYGRSREERAWADYQKRHAAWEQRQFGSKSGAAPVSSQGGASLATLMGPGQWGGGGVPLGASAASDVSGNPAQAPIEMQMPGNGASLADLARWSDHRKYLGA